MFAFVTAGSVPNPDDPLYAETQGGPKALLDVGGKPMVQWVLDSLGAARQVEGVVLVGPESANGLTCAKTLWRVPDQGGLLANIEAGVKEILRLSPSALQVLAVSSDIPAITPEMVDWAIEVSAGRDDDLVYLVVERKTMEARFPESNRTYIRLSDGEFCGSDMNVMRAALVNDPAFWERLVAARKSPLKQASLLGPDLVLLILLRQMSLARAERMVSRRLRLRGRAVRCPYAEMAMDVDKPHQLALLRAELAEKRSGMA
jgi:hypothetical protein